MKQASCAILTCFAVLIAATAETTLGGETQNDLLPGSGLTVAQAMAGRFGMIAVCEATGEAQIELGTPPNAVNQSFRLVEVLAGKAPDGAIGKTVAFGYRVANGERAAHKGERLIWIAQQPNEDEWEATKALADRPENRKLVADVTPPAPEKP